MQYSQGKKGEITLEIFYMMNGVIFVMLTLGNVRKILLDVCLP